MVIVWEVFVKDIRLCPLITVLMSVLQWCGFNWIWKWCNPKQWPLSLLILVWMIAHSHSQGGQPTFWFILNKWKPNQQWLTLHHWQSHFKECLLCPTHKQLLIYVSSSLLPSLYSTYFLLLQISWWQLTRWLSAQGLPQSTRPQTLWRRCNENWIHNSPSSPGTVLKESSHLIRSPFFDCTCSFFFSTNKHLKRKKIGNVNANHTSENGQTCGKVVILLLKTLF